MADRKQWEMNETQKSFVKILADNREQYPDGMTLREIKKVSGIAFKTGSINTLISKGVVEVADGEYQVSLVYRDVVIGSVKKSWKVYKLVK